MDKRSEDKAGAGSPAGPPPVGEHSQPSSALWLRPWVSSCGPGRVLDPQSHRSHNDCDEPSRRELDAEHLDDRLGRS
jgi:hypothetical protein